MLHRVRRQKPRVCQVSRCARGNDGSRITDTRSGESVFVCTPSFAEQLLPAVLPCASRAQCALEGVVGSTEAGRTQDFSQEDFHVTSIAQCTEDVLLRHLMPLCCPNHQSCLILAASCCGKAEDENLAFYNLFL